MKSLLVISKHIQPFRWLIRLRQLSNAGIATGTSLYQYIANIEWLVSLQDSCKAMLILANLSIRIG